MNYDILKIAEITQGNLIGNLNDNYFIQRIIIDSRFYIKSNENYLFIAIKGKNNDGHNFIEDLYNQGVRAFIIEKELDKYYPNAYFIKVNNSISALQDIATYHRKQFSYKVIGITGSYAKSIIKEWLFDILEEKLKIVRSPKSFNSQIGVALSVLQMDNNYELGIFEAGISQANEMDKLERIIKPTIGIFTNIGKAHQENFTSIESKIEEKVKLFKDCENIIIPSAYQNVIQIIKKLYPKKQLLTWGYNTDDKLKVTSIERKNLNTFIKFSYNNKFYIIDVPFTQDVFIENVLTTLLCALQFETNIDYILSKIKQLKPIEMRLEMVDGINNSTLINDFYNSDINSISVALNFLQQQNKHPKKAIIISDIPSSGQPVNEIYSTLAKWINDYNINLLIGIGKEISAFSHLFATSNSVFYNDVESFINKFPLSELNNTTILLKGARKFAFERISLLLQRQLHETTLNIDLNALLHNLQVYKSLLAVDTRIMVMIKAFSYGSGLNEIARLLQNNVDYLAVAFTDEAIELRKSGISLPIMIMSPEIHTFASIIENNLEPVIYNFRSLRTFAEIAKKTGFLQIPFHLKLDTGMHRLGFCNYEIDELIKELKKYPWLKLVSVYSHLASADDPKDDFFTKKQIHNFIELCNILKRELKQNFITHIQNSAGIERFNNYKFDMVRIGIGLYGIAKTHELRKKLLPVLSFKTVISQIKHLKKGDSISYNRKGIMKKDGKIAVLPIGYADGLNRKLGNGAFYVKINNQKAYTIGTICMDMTMVDVSDLNVHEGDEVIIFDSIEDIDRISNTLNTIPYEIFTGISRRVKRVYYHD